MNVTEAALPANEDRLSVVVQNENTPPDDRDLTLQTYEDNQEEKKGPVINNEMIPEELLFALTQPQLVNISSKEDKLSPVKNIKTPEKLRQALKKGPPANVWHHKARRTQFKHLTDNPRSLGKGVGTRDISFLYDVATQQNPRPPSPSKLDKSAVRLEASGEAPSAAKLAVPDTIIPEEYHIVKSKAVLGLEYIDERLTTMLTDREQTLRIFPSLQPTKRFEVVQLLRTLEGMLEKSGIEDETLEVKGPTQIHNLLQLIKKEQNIYDLVFSEVIRQVSIECVERGQLLSTLRQKYAALLNRIPRQIKSLHAEVMAQRSLDRRLTEELLRFKSSITFLTNELQTVREHDHQVTTDAEIAEAELAKALKESQTNANLVDEYHDLYELQRHRLESNVSSLTSEKDLWSNAAYSLALKITSANSLNTAKRLHVSEKAWSKLSNHFTVMLSDHDSECLSTMQNHVENWRELMFHFNQALESADKRTTHIMNTVKKEMHKWIAKFDDTLMSSTSDVRSIKIPPDEFVNKLCDAMKGWEEKLGEDSERFGGGMLLTNQEQLNKMTKETEAWTEVAWHIYRRHRSDDGESFPLSQTMINVNSKLHDIVKQLDIRIAGENGVAKGMINLQNSLDIWVSKLFLMQHGSESLTDTEWLQLYDRLSEYIAVADETLEIIGSQQRDEDRLNGAPHTRINVEDMMKSVQDWMKCSLNQIEAEDGKLMAQVSSIHTNLIHWMVQMLLHLAPDHHSKQSDFPSETSLLASCTLEELTKKAHSISDHMSYFTNYFCECCYGIVLSMMQEKKDQGDEDADHEYRDFLRVKREGREWIRTCEILLNSIVDDDVTVLTPRILERLQLPDEKKSPTGTFPGSRPTTQEGSDRSQTPPEKVVSVASLKGVKAAESKNAVIPEITIPLMNKTENVEEKNDEEKTDENKHTVEDATSPSEKFPVRMEVLGSDENVQSAELAGGGAILSASNSGELTPPSSSLTQSAYDAIAKMDQIQDQLLATEKRAQIAEERVTDLEEELHTAHEKIRAAEKKIEAFEKERTATPAEQKPDARPSDTPTGGRKSSTDGAKSAGTSKPNDGEATKRAPSRGSPSVKKAKATKKK